MATEIFNVPSISCGGCARRIEAGLKEVPGIDAVAVQLTSRTVQVDFAADEVDGTKIRGILAELGYPAEPADPATELLPTTCHIT